MLELQNLTAEDGNTMVDPAVVEVVKAFNTETDTIAARIEKLIASGTGLSVESKALLQGVVDRLHVLGQDPENPIP